MTGAPKDTSLTIDTHHQLSCALDVLKLDGVLLFSNVQGIYLGDPRLEPVFTELDRRAATVFVHPNPSPDPVAHRLGLPDSLIDALAGIGRRTVGRTVSGLIILAHHPGPDVCGTIAKNNTTAGFVLAQEVNGVTIRED